MGIHDRCQNDNKRNLADLSGLNHKGQAGDIQPASVAGVVIRTEGNQHQQHHEIERYQQVAVFRHGFHVDGGHDGIHEHTHCHGGQLDNQITGVAVELGGAGCAGQHHAAKRGCNQAQQKQYHITFFEEAFEFKEKLLQSAASFPALYFTINAGKSK